MGYTLSDPGDTLRDTLGWFAGLPFLGFFWSICLGISKIYHWVTWGSTVDCAGGTPRVPHPVLSSRFVFFLYVRDATAIRKALFVDYPRKKMKDTSCANSSLKVIFVIQ